MPDEILEDDEILYDIWRRLSVHEVEGIFLRLYVLAHSFAELRGARPDAAMVARAEELRDGPLALGHLPIVASILARA